MVVVGGQDGGNHYIEQISVFNLRSLEWAATTAHARSCGAYRSVVAPLTTVSASKIGAGPRRAGAQLDEPEGEKTEDGGASLLIYSNYNFLDVKLELQVRLRDGTLVEKPMQGNHSPPGLRFPNGGVIADHFVVSGTFLTSSKQEYALWALDLRTLAWSKIDAGGSIFSQGSWNRGVLWNRRNAFVILGNRERSLVDDYNHRRINFRNICIVELEAFGLYDNPRRTSPTSDYISVSSPAFSNPLQSDAGGRQLSEAAQELGELALSFSEFADMDFLAITGERIPVNSHLVARRWGPYFNQLLRQGIATQQSTDTATLRPTAHDHPSRNSSITITPSIKTAYSATTTLTPHDSISASSSNTAKTATIAPSPFDPLDARTPNPSTRPRTLYLPHTYPTLQALVHYLYTSSLPPPPSSLSTPQILCSLLQIARPYRVDGLLEAVVERLHAVLDGRNTAAIFNAAAMAAGGGDGVAFFTGVSGGAVPGAEAGGAPGALGEARWPTQRPGQGPDGAVVGMRGLRINTDVGGGRAAGEARSATSTSTSGTISDFSGSGVGTEEGEVWSGELSAVVGLQKRGLRGLMEGRRIREMGRGEGGGGGGGGVAAGAAGEGRLGLGIA